jgi:tRNA A37 methylthiotransferase MiaB
MMSPKYAKNIIDDLIELYTDEKMYKFIHLPLQSGDNDLLREMNRGYTVEDFSQICSKFREVSNDTIIATDIIVGHPKESEEAFQNTIRVVQEVKPDVLHVFRYSKREGTVDSKLKELKTQIKKERSRILVDLFQKYNLEKNKEFLNKELEVLVLEDNNLARTNSGRAVIVKNGKAGEFRKVKIIDYNWNYLIGK